MAIPTSPATPEQMQVESIQELDRMRMMSIQSLAMQRIRDSVVTLSRETGFRERPVEQFTQAPLYIPQYQQWSNTQQKLVGTAPPQMPSFAGGKYRYWQGAASRAQTGISILEGTYTPPTNMVWNTGSGRWETSQQPMTFESILSGLSSSRYGRENQPWANYLREYQAWQQAQRSLPT